MDWEEFKRITVKLNRPRTKIQRRNIYLEAAEESWECLQLHILNKPKEKVNKLWQYAANAIKKARFIAAYVSLLTAIAIDDNIIPAENRIEAPSKMVELFFARDMDINEVQRWSRENYNEDTEKLRKPT